jgi:CoA-transferase family III
LASVSTERDALTNDVATQILLSCGGFEGPPIDFDEHGSYASAFKVSVLAAGSIGAASRAAIEFAFERGMVAENDARVVVHRRLSSAWFRSTLRSADWDLPPMWDALAGDYETADGWIKLHTNAPHHRDAALRALGCKRSATRAEVAAAVARERAVDVETAVVSGGGCAAEMLSRNQWALHPQGVAVSTEAVVAFDRTDDRDERAPRRSTESPLLAGIRVLDLTRVLAGPVATRWLAGLGAQVLHIDPPEWDEPGVAMEVTRGKRCARLDLRTPSGIQRLRDLLREADVLVHGYRRDALESLGLGAQARRELRPGLVDVCLDAYGHTGPWRNRRGFDSLVQMSTGIAAEGMTRSGEVRPVPLPVQALDHAAGYVLAAAALRGLTERARDGRGVAARTSLARVAEMLVSLGDGSFESDGIHVDDGDLEAEIEVTSWGRSKRLRPPVTIEGVLLTWDLPAVALGTHEPVWV